MTIYLRISTGIQFPHSAPIFLSPFQKFVPIIIFNNFRDISKLLLFFGDVKTNPGPRSIDENPVFCCICSSKIDRGIQEDTAPTCSETNCNEWCHQACNGLTTNQTCHAKSCGCTITWKCPQHGTGITETIIPPPPVFQLPSRPSTVGKLCSICNNPIWSHYANLAYPCGDLSCANVCHLSATCSGFANHRGTTRLRIFSTRIWYCHLHSSPLTTEHSSTQYDTSPAHLTPNVIKVTLESRHISSWR